MDSPADIPPDTKDWTWVIAAGCPECGFVPPDATEVAARTRATIPRWQAVLGRPDAPERPSPQVWSPLEYGCHVRDVCAVFGVRARLILTQDEPTFANWDQDQTAIQERYHAQDPADVALEYATEAERTAEIFERVPAGAWERPGRRSNGARFTTASLAVYFLHDLEHHLYDVAG